MLDALSRARLNWMFDNQPDIVKELLDKKRLAELERLLDGVVIPAMQLKNQLMKKGMSNEEAEQQALEFSYRQTARSSATTRQHPYLWKIRSR
jgi:hypothetical protein